MTTAGTIFKGYAEVITERHGFGAKKMVKETDNKRMMELLREIDEKGIKREISREDVAQQMMKVGEAHRWLITNGYIQYFDAGHDVKKGSYTHTGVSRFIGLTAKGWSVANKYLNA